MERRGPRVGASFPSVRHVELAGSVSARAVSRRESRARRPLQQLPLSARVRIAHPRAPVSKAPPHRRSSVVGDQEPAQPSTTLSQDGSVVLSRAAGPPRGSDGNRIAPQGRLGRLHRPGAVATRGRLAAEPATDVDTDGSSHGGASQQVRVSGSVGVGEAGRAASDDWASMRAHGTSMPPSVFLHPERPAVRVPRRPRLAPDSTRAGEALPVRGRTLRHRGVGGSAMATRLDQLAGRGKDRLSFGGDALRRVGSFGQRPHSSVSGWSQRSSSRQATGDLLANVNLQ